MTKVGGFAVGRTFVVDHQVLSGAGYCYSASLPPLLAVAALQALQLIDSRKDLQSKVVANAKTFRDALAGEFKKAKCTSLEIGGDILSPVVHVRVGGVERLEADSLLDAVVRK